MASKLSLYSQLARPFTLLPPLLGIVSGAVCAFGSVHNPDPSRQLTMPVVLTVILGSVCASLMNAASNAINQIYDLEIDRLNKPNRPLVTGALSVREAWIFTWIFYTLALIPTWLVVPHPYDTLEQKLTAPLSEHVTFFIYLAGLLFTFVYSAPELGRTKVRGMLANLTIAIPRGVLLKVAGWAMVAHVAFTEPWYIGAVIGFFLIGAASTKDFADMEGDRAGGCKTLPILYGPRKAAWIMAPFFVFPWLLLPLGAHLRDPQNPQHAILTGNPLLLTIMGVLFTLWGLYTVYLLVRDPDSLTETENHPSWKHMYLMMMGAQVGLALAYMF
ncbi:MAG: geranylgeranylglycerol-phosphate geranylgeranyltransferase [Acidobacteriota bacterium]|jgi:4-hydroxybenzoate polyprenyltransferase|nr:geranylgeranylglycerol-phosphate geranylgeranyltransferase [Acidobacteriota bacterium]